MGKDTIRKKLNSLVEQPASTWIDYANWIEENETWLNKSAMIALKILRTLKERSLSQKDLAETIGVSSQYINKVVKGSENLSLQTICKIEDALGISLIEVPEYDTIIEFDAADFITANYVGNYNTLSVLKGQIQYSQESIYVGPQDLKRA